MWRKVHKQRRNFEIFKFFSTVIKKPEKIWLKAYVVIVSSCLFGELLHILALVYCTDICAKLKGSLLFSFLFSTLLSTVDGLLSKSQMARFRKDPL